MGSLAQSSSRKLVFMRHDLMVELGVIDMQLEGADVNDEPGLPQDKLQNLHERRKKICSAISRLEA